VFTTLHPLAAALLAALPAPAPQDLPTAQDPEIPADTEIVTTDSGLMYSILQPGTGDTARLGDRVRVHYSGWTTDGKMFDSSRKRGVPFEFSVGRGVIEGWSEAARLMSPGARFKLTIPGDLAYGERGRPPRIPGNATLIFDVELLAITARTLDWVPWDAAAESKTTDSGARLQTVVAGDGPPGAEADYTVIEWALWTPSGELKSSSVMDSQTLAVDPQKLPFAFITEAVRELNQGGRVLMEVPRNAAADALGRLRVTLDTDTSLWQFELVSALTFEPPTFVMPDASELTTTESGLQYKVLRAGTGRSPTVDQSVVSHYCGWTTDSVKFDSSYDRGEPTSFPLASVIAGWTEGLQLMREGGKTIFVIPGDLAYGKSGSPPSIGPNATLVFVVELLRVQ
jgi:FKBP-type peptidyl-prolyl cis-trans isomerase